MCIRAFYLYGFQNLAKHIHKTNLFTLMFNTQLNIDLIIRGIRRNTEYSVSMEKTEHTHPLGAVKNTH